MILKKIPKIFFARIQMGGACGPYTVVEMAIFFGKITENYVKTFCKIT